MASPLTPGDAPLSGRGAGAAGKSPREPSPTIQRPPPRSLGDALRAAGMTIDGPSTGPGSETPSEEDYEENIRPTLTEPNVVRQRYTRRGRQRAETPSFSSVDFKDINKDANLRFSRRDSGIHIVPDDDKSLQQLLKASSQWTQDASPKRRPRKFADLVFTRQFSAFDRQNPSSVNSPFHGFYTLFWLAVTLYVLKISVENWQMYGNILGTSDIVETMFHRDVILLLISDGIMCALTAVTWLIQRCVFANYLNWDGAGWVIQHVSTGISDTQTLLLSHIDMANSLHCRCGWFDPVA
ncbi:hypothetical protein CEP53_009814 [Fusarium sp. AF-6]|nr:hypothetical protein CEP53_009814 [Fusarium sp. AF-6]